MNMRCESPSSGISSGSSKTGYLSPASILHIGQNKVQNYESKHKLPTNTLKRHPKMLELSKTELLQLLSYLEGELQAREVVIATLRSEKAKSLLYQAKYGKFGLDDPYAALIRDSTTSPDASFDESQIKQMYENQLQQLEALISQQKQAHRRMKEHLHAAEKRHSKVVNELEEEKKKHAQDTAQGDDVTYMLEKDRERLRVELEKQKRRIGKLEKELRKTLTVMEEEHEKHKRVAVLLVQERKELSQRLTAEQQKCDELTQALKEQREKYENVADGLVEESQKSLRMETSYEKLQSEYESEKKLWRAKLERQEDICGELQSEVELLRQQLEAQQLGDGSARISGVSSSVVSSKGYQKPLSEVLPSALETGRSHSGPPMSKQIYQINTARSTSVVSKSYVAHPIPSKATPVTIPPSTARVSASPASLKPQATSSAAKSVSNTASPKPPELPPKQRELSGIAGLGPTRVAPPTVTTVTGQSPHVAVPVTAVVPGQAPRVVPSVTASVPGPARGAPPPVPPNKPVLKSATQRVADSASEAKSGSGTAGAREKVGVQNPGGPTVPRIPNTNQSNGNNVMGKASTQVGDGATDDSDGANLDIFGPELADLQQLLVSMVTGGPPSVDDDNSSTVLTQLLFTAADMGDTDKLKSLLDESTVDVDVALGNDKSTALIIAASKGHDAFLQLLLEKEPNLNCYTSTGTTALHAAALYGHERCVRLLVDAGADATIQDQNGKTALHLASTAGHVDCVKLLVSAAPAVCIVRDKNGCTAMHCSIEENHPDCLELLIKQAKLLSTFNPISHWNRKSPDRFIPYRSPYRKPQDKQASAKSVSMSESPATRYSPDKGPSSLADIVDEMGQTLTHAAALQQSPECLEVLHVHSLVSLLARDKQGKKPVDVASSACKQILHSIVNNEDRVCMVVVELDETACGGKSDTAVSIGTVMINCATTWQVLEDSLRHLVAAHFAAISEGVKTRRTSKGGSDAEQEYETLGLTFESVKECAIGTKRWKVGYPLTASPGELLQEADNDLIAVYLYGFDVGRLDNLAYDTLIPTGTLHNYLRLIDQYRSLVFYGPSGVGKSYLAKKLAQSIQEKEQQAGNRSEITYVSLSSSYSRRNLVNLLSAKDCLLRAEVPAMLNHAPVIILDDLSKIDVSEVFGEILTAIERRGPANAISVKIDADSEPHLYYLLNECYIIGTMDKSRSQSLDLSIQQRFRWVHCRIDTEPVRSQLSRHLLRRVIHKYGGQLPTPGDPVYRAVEWVFSVWQRLNECLAKLGLPELVFGPRHFYSCPIEMNKPKAILRWLSLSWNHAIAPAVENAILKGPKSSAPIGQQTLVETALFVLLQRAVLPGCPISGADKDRYIGSYRGGQELQQHLQKVDDTSVIPVRSPASVNAPEFNSTSEPINIPHPNAVEGKVPDPFSPRATARSLIRHSSPDAELSS